MLKAKKLFYIFLLVAGNIHAQSLAARLSQIDGIIYRQIPNNSFREYYEIFVEQPMDHNNSFSPKFKQRIILGFNSFDSATVMDTDGYGIAYAVKPDYSHELASLLHSNLIIVEHRFFGSSAPSTMDYTYLTVKQAAEDDHIIRTLFATLFQKKWISTGISKGGQAALSYKLFFPEDVNASVLYVTPLKQAFRENKVDSMLSSLSQTSCGKKLDEFQLNAFKNKSSLLKVFNDHKKEAGLDFGAFDDETILDYMLLELPFSFWQSGASCENIPGPAATPVVSFDYLNKVIPASFYSAKNLKRLQPAYYMNYHELGYYDYPVEKFKKQLKQADYSALNFAPAMKITFDPTYLNAVQQFIYTDPATDMIFIYGEHDPWASMQNTGKAKKIIIKNGSHKSRIADMDKEQKGMLLQFIAKKLH